MKASMPLRGNGALSCPKCVNDMIGVKPKGFLQRFLYCLIRLFPLEDARDSQSGPRR